MKILIGIVTYNPDLERFAENISMICNQGKFLIVFDNGSENSKEISDIVIHHKGKFIDNKKNRGIAYGLKYIMDYAATAKFDWVLTLDQDSVAAENLLEEYKKHIDYPDVGAMTCIIKDRNIVSMKSSSDKVEEINSCITSGCFMNVGAYGKTPGYDEKLFIDFVDFDICFSLIEEGYKVIKIPYEGLLHEVGHGKNVVFLKKNYIVYNQQYWRRYYIVRNDIYVSKKHRELQPLLRTVLRQTRNILLVCIFENQKLKKFFLGVKGLLAGLFMPIT